MSQKLKVVEIATKALEVIGSYPTSMVAPDPDELRRAVEWLDLLVAELAGTKRLFFLTPATVTGALTSGVSQYTLSTLLGTGYPATGMVFPVRAYLRYTNGSDYDDYELPLITRREYEEIPDKDGAGTPEVVYIDRLNSAQQLYVYPVPQVSTFSLRLVIQSYPTTMTGGTPEKAGKLDHGFAQECQHYLINILAARIGSGPVRRLPVGEIDRIVRDSQIQLASLISAATERQTSMQVVKPLF